MVVAVFILCCVACMANVLDSISAKTKSTKVISGILAITFIGAAIYVAGGNV